MNDIYHSPSYGDMCFAEIRKHVLQFMEVLPESKYSLVIGTDSQPDNCEGTNFITAIVVHRIGKGGIYFWKRQVTKKILVLRERIYQEATISLQTAEELLAVFKNDGITKYDVEIHVDVGNHGKSREMITEIVGMVIGSGFMVKTKPDSYGASKVADRHT